MPTTLETCAICPLGKHGHIGHKGCSLTITTSLPEGRSIQDMAEGGVCAHPDDFFKNAEKMPPRPAAKSEPPSPVPRDQWPLWASEVARWRGGDDIGVGDTFHVIAVTTGAALAVAALSKLGLPCNCAERRQEWNTRYPY